MDGGQLERAIGAQRAAGDDSRGLRGASDESRAAVVPQHLVCMLSGDMSGESGGVSQDDPAE